MLLATAHSLTWPDGIDRSAILLYLGIFVGLPVLGYFCMVLDFRAYLRSLRRALMVIQRTIPSIPSWARQDTPACLIALGLSLPSSREQVLTAYRQRVKLLHPDRGGDREKFMRLQRHFEAAIEFVDDTASE
jgi:hypothetical protein